MPENNKWDGLRNAANAEVCFPDTNGNVHIVRWGDIKGKSLTSNGNATLVMDDTIVGRIPHFSGVAQSNRTISVSAQTLVDIYQQVGAPLPETMAKALARYNVKLDGPSTPARPG